MELSPHSVFVHIVSFNSQKYLKRCVRSVLSQRHFALGDNLIIQVTDNHSHDGSADLVRAEFGETISVVENEANLGFCGGHNQGVYAFLQSRCRFLLVLNPDVCLEADALGQLTDSLAADPKCGLASARLMRADEDLNPLTPAVFDSAGIVMTPSLRHFDRGSGEVDRGQYRSKEYVFGATGACLLLSRECILDLIVDAGSADPFLSTLYPQLTSNRSRRTQLFDEAFFAYREDADLAWRANLFGWKCLYEPGAVGYHKRVVLPERRRSLPPDLNRMSVRNRFLLQLNNFTLAVGLRALIEGVVFRNIVVLVGVLLTERSSLSALREAVRLRHRSHLRRKVILSKASTRTMAAGAIGRWFRLEPYAERA